MIQFIEKKLGELLEPFDERLESNKEPEILTLTEGKGFVSQRERFKKRLATEDTSNYKLVRKHDIAFNPYLLWAGAIAQNVDWDEAIISPAYPTFRIRKGYDPRYVDRLIGSGPMILAYDGIAFGSVPRRRRTTVEDFLNLPVMVPKSQPEQKRIAAILDKADGIRRKRQQALRLTDDFLRSVFLDMFGDPVTNPMGWELQNLNHVIGKSFRNGLSPSSKGTVEGKVLTLTAITTGSFSPEHSRDALFDRPPSENQTVTSDTFLICRGNGNKRKVGIGVFPQADMKSVVFPDTMIACTIDRDLIEPEYLQLLWSTAHVRNQIEAGARTTNGTYKVNQTLLGSIEFPLPPIALQKTFSRIVRASRASLLKANKATASSSNLFSSLQQRAFRGEL